MAGVRCSFHAMFDWSSAQNEMVVIVGKKLVALTRVDRHKCWEVLVGCRRATSQKGFVYNHVPEWS
jgi:hypothetical protein